MFTLDHTLKPEAVRRLEVITGTGRRRRRFSKDEKAGVVEETLAPGAVVSEVARRHGLSPQQLFGWRRQARELTAAGPEPTVPLFVPAVVEAPSPERSVRGRGCKRRGDAELATEVIEVEIDGVTVRPAARPKMKRPPRTSEPGVPLGGA
jgi:transposase